MRDNFDVHAWNLKRYLNEAEKTREDIEAELEKSLGVDFKIDSRRATN